MHGSIHRGSPHRWSGSAPADQSRRRSLRRGSVRARISSIDVAFVTPSIAAFSAARAGSPPPFVTARRDEGEAPFAAPPSVDVDPPALTSSLPAPTASSPTRPSTGAVGVPASLTADVAAASAAGAAGARTNAAPATTAKAATKRVADAVSDRRCGIILIDGFPLGKLHRPTSPGGWNRPTAAFGARQGESTASTKPLRSALKPAPFPPQSAPRPFPGNGPRLPQLPMPPPTIPAAEASPLLAALKARERRIVMIAAGGGSAAIPALVALPGASEVVLEALVPSSRLASDAILGGPQESYCSSRAARRLAMAAWERCGRYGAPADRAVGVASTASLATTVPKRGDHRIIVAVQTLRETSVASLVLAKGARTRAEEEALAATLVLARIAESPDDVSTTEARLAPLLRPDERLTFQRQSGPPAWQAVLSGASRSVRLSGQGGREAIFPGSFDPLHDGHRTMARIGERITGLPVAYELSIRNVEKPALDFVEIAARAAGFGAAPAWLTSAATFVEKVALFPGAPFLVGADTFVRLGHPRYSGGSTDAAAEAVRRIATESGGLVVFGRVRDGVFTDPARLEAPQALRDISRFVSEEEFRDDVSSTSLRRAGATADG